MKHALRVAKRHAGLTGARPSVGAVVVKDGAVLGAACTAAGGIPHAEPQALKQAGKAAKGATLYVTLEPCCHEGKTPPCVDSVIKAGIARVVIALEDPDVRVAGGGVAKLKDAGIVVEVGVCAEEAARHHAGFILSKTKQRPLVTLKLATSLDGKIATKSGESQWITGQAARDYVHVLRYRHDAVMVGMGTVMADNPQLTCRLPGLEHGSPQPVVLGDRIIPSDYGMAQKGMQITTKMAGIGMDGKLSLHNALKHLANEGVTSVLVEGGGQLAASFIKAKLVDELIWMQAPMVIGADGLPAIGDLKLQHLADSAQFTLRESRMLGDDRVTRYARSA